MLKGDEIPLGARILAVADAYDSMTSDRSYRKALSREVAIDEIMKNSGKQFDPYIAKLFLAYLERQGRRAEELWFILKTKIILTI